MRIGKNPFKERKEVARPKDVTCCILTCTPSISGYWRKSREVIHLCLLSMRLNTNIPHDIMVLDNGSCTEFTTFLKSLHDEGLIDTLILSASNLGKIGGINCLFGAAQGRHLVYADGDIYFAEGWLEEHLRIHDTFARRGLRIGMISGRPWPTCNPQEIIDRAGIAALPDIAIEDHIIPQEVIDEHLLDIGARKGEQTRCKKWYRDEGKAIVADGVKAFLCAIHMQFMMPAQVARQLFPLKVTRPLSKHDDRQIDHKVLELGLAKLSPVTPCVRHVGNHLDAALRQEYERLQQRWRQEGKAHRKRCEHPGGAFVYWKRYLRQAILGAQRRRK